MVHCPSKCLIPIKPSKAMSSRDISDFVGLSLHFSLIFSCFSYFLLFMKFNSNINDLYQIRMFIYQVTVL